MQTKRFFIAIAFLIAGITGFASTGNISHPVAIDDSQSDSIKINSYKANKDMIRLYPNPTTDGTILVNSMTNEQMHFYIFDLEGVLISRVELKSKEQKRITNLKKGTYLYDVFKNDESIEQGNIIVK